MSSSIRTKVFFPAQQNNGTTSSPYHRVHHSNEIRRWKVASFEDLQQRIQNVLSTLSTDTNTQYRFEYLDDVNDWVVLEHPDEWEEAVASSSHNILVLRVIPRVVTKRPCQQRPPTRRGAHCARKAAHQQPATYQALLSSGLSGALHQALPFIIQLAAPASSSPKAATPQAKRSVPIQSPSSAPEHIEVRRMKSVPVPVESAQEGPVEIPVTKSAPSAVRRIPIEDAAEEIAVRKNTSIEVEAPQEAQSVEIPVTVAPASPVRSIPIEDAPAQQDAQQDDDVPLVEKEESKPLDVDVEMSGIPQTDYTIENDEDAHEIIIDEDKEDDESEAAPQQNAEERQQFQSEQDILQSMGFQDSKLNFHLLRHHNGNMERTINSLLQLEQ